MASPILMQNENLTKELSKSKIGRSSFNLSHSKTFPMYIGAIYPCMCLPTMPTESVEINVTALLKQLSPLTVPLMADLKLNIAYFWVDYRLAWKKFERFMQGGRSGNEVYQLPKFYDATSGQGVNLLGLLTSDNAFHRSPHNSLRTYFGITKNYTTELPEAISFFGYQMIIRDFYTNVDRLSESTSSTATPNDYDNDDDWTYNNLFPADPDVFRLQDGPQSQVNGVQLGKLRYHEFRPDYFLSSCYAPMRGNAPQLPIAEATLNIPQGTPFILDSNQPNHGLLYDRNGQPLDELFTRIQFGGEDIDFSHTLMGTLPANSQDGILSSISVSGLPQYQSSTTKLIVGKSATGNVRTLYGENAQPIPVSGTVSANVTAAQLTWLNQLTTYKELNVLCKPYYKDFLNAHFENVRIGEEQTERPIYIGGCSQSISISEVTQVSQSTDSSPIGTVGAKAGSLDSNNIGQFFCNNYGVIIGLAYIMPDMIYEPALPRWLTRETNLDFYSPEFANLSMQAILNKELFVSDNNTWNNEALGYQGAFDELRSMPNQVAGDMLNDSMQDLQHYVLLRKFSNENKPELTHEFLSTRHNIDYSAWALNANTVAPFIGQFANYVNAIMPMPYVAVPKH